MIHRAKAVLATSMAELLVRVDSAERQLLLDASPPFAPPTLSWRAPKSYTLATSSFSLVPCFVLLSPFASLSIFFFNDPTYSNLICV